MTNTNQLDQLTALKERLRIRHARLTEKLAEVAKQLEAVDTTIGLLRRGDEADREEVPLAASRDLQGMTQLEAITYMAKRNAGKIRIADVKKALIRAGLMRPTKNSYNIVFTVMKRSERFKRIGSGEYELLPEESSVVLLRKAPVA